jgi:predicted ATPase
LLPQGVIAEIAERTDGVPLFVEEMTKAVLETGAERGREIAASVPSTRLGVPATLQASLMARLDRLGAAAKGVAQIGAAIGREFSYELAAVIGEPSEERLREALQRLVDAGLVFQRGAPPTAEYSSSTPWSRIRPTALCCAARGSNSMPGSPKRSKPNSPS